MMIMMETRADSAPGSSQTIRAMSHPAKMARAKTIPKLAPRWPMPMSGKRFTNVRREERDAPKSQRE